MNRHGKKERLTSVPILCQITLHNTLYKDYKLLVLTSFEVTTVTCMDSQEPAYCDLIRHVLEALNSTEDGTTNVSSC